MKLFFVIIGVVIFSSISYSQENLIGEVNDLYDSVGLREYNLDKIKKGYEPLYERDLNKGNIVDIIGMCNDYLIVIFKLDTFSIHNKFIKSDYLTKISEEKAEIRKEKERIEVLNRKKEKEEWIEFLNTNNSWIKKIKPSIAIVKESSMLEEINNKKRLFVFRDSVELVGFSADTAFVFHKGRLYYTKLKHLKSDIADSLLIVFEENRRNILRLAEMENKKMLLLSREKRKEYLISKYGKENADFILKGNVYVGMTDEMAKESWGNPYKINRTVTQYGNHEQWVYRNDCYLYFDNGKLTTIQN